MTDRPDNAPEFRPYGELSTEERRRVDEELAATRRRLFSEEIRDRIRRRPEPEPESSEPDPLVARLSRKEPER
jgi:hypothetical protein